MWLFGGQEREVHVVLDYQAMTARGLTIQQVRDALLRENRNTKGNIDEGKKRFGANDRTILRPQAHRRNDHCQPGWARGLRARYRHVRFGLKERDRSIRQFGDPTVGFGVVRRTGANTVEVMKGVKRELAYLNAIYADKGMQFEQVYDETDYIYDAVSLVTENVYEASLLTVLVLLFFLRSISSILVIGLSIPISVVTTFIVLNALGRS